MYTHKVRLIHYSEERDAIGNLIKTPVETIILGKKNSVSQSEFYKASTSDFKPDIKLTLHKFEYNNQQTLILDDITYRVIKTYEAETRIESRYDRYKSLRFDEIELTCERVIGS